MTPPEAEQPERRREENLAAENKALNEQIKLLVQTEQRLYRSQNQLDRQLSRIRALGDFSIGCTGLETPAEILQRGVDVLLESFRIERALILGLGRESGWLVAPPGDPGEVEPSAELVSWAAEERGAFFGTLGEAPRALRDLLERYAPPGLVVSTIAIPLRRRTADPSALLLAWTVAGSSFYVEPPTEKHRPFLVLYANHLEHALQNAELARDLTERGEELARTNARLSSSLDKLEGAQQQLLQARKMEAIGRLAGGVAHDFNNLLTVILNNTRLAQLEIDPESEAHENLSLVAAASDRGANITKQLLAFSRKDTSTKEHLDLNELVIESARMLDRLIGEHITLQTELDEHLGPVTADRTQLEQVLLNVVVNARDAMPAGGTVTIATRFAAETDSPLLEGEDAAEFRALVVSDTGHGMNNETRAQVFDPFFTTKLLGRGTGLGLSVVYGAIQQNRGKISVDSEPGEGTTFTILLPAAGDGEPAVQLAAPERLPARNATVLLVEDEAAIRQVAARILRREGLEVLEAIDGASALEIADLNPAFDVLVTDMLMPGMGGLELAAALRSRLPELPVIYVSGYSYELPEARGPGEAFLQKPFDPDSLVQAVARALLSTPRRAREH